MFSFPFSSLAPCEGELSLEAKSTRTFILGFRAIHNRLKDTSMFSSSIVQQKMWTYLLYYVKQMSLYSLSLVVV